ncbi:MAG: methyltransferase domain-containing protein [Thermoleophilia bacterium]|nr:methyltransferase domain-containing protein [Thermoleophilia bacterium]
MEPTERNRRAWDAAHRRRRGAAGGGLPELVRGWLPDVRGRHVLHFPCGTGEATAELVALGALVTALDPSEQAVGETRARVPAAAAVAGDPQRLPPELLRERFHLVYAAEGTLALAQDLPALARGAAAALRPGGFLLVHDEHPLAAHIDPLLHWRGSYFHASRPTLAAAVTAVAQAGLVVRRLGELPAPSGNANLPGRFTLVARK